MPDARRPPTTVSTPSPTPSPAAAAGTAVTRTCPCGRAEFDRCCYPVALRLRAGRGGERLPASPFDELRASAALMLWGLTAGTAGGTDQGATSEAAVVRRGLSSAARRFWGAAASEPSLPTAAPPDSGSAYGAALFRRTWPATDDGTRTWLLGTLPPGLRYDAVLGELALDWLLWDAPWLQGQPAAAWFLRTYRSTTRRIRTLIGSLLRSRPGLYRLADSGEPSVTRPDPPVAGGLELVDLLGGPAVRVDTPTPAWPDPERRLLVRTYRFGNWRLAAGEGLLLSPETAGELVERLERDRRNQDVPGWPDPRRDHWLAGRLLPLAAALWTAARTSPTVAPPTDGRYDVLLG